jgi:hypothetical protein
VQFTPGVAESYLQPVQMETRAWDLGRKLSGARCWWWLVGWLTGNESNSPETSYGLNDDMNGKLATVAGTSSILVMSATEIHHREATFHRHERDILSSPLRSLGRFYVDVP